MSVLYSIKMDGMLVLFLVEMYMEEGRLFSTTYGIFFSI